MENIIEFPDRAVIIEEASEWVIKMTGETALTAEQQAALELWLAQSPQHKAILQELASTWSGMDILSELELPQESAPARSNSLSVIAWWLLAPLWLLARALKAAAGLITTLLPPQRAFVAASLMGVVSLVLWMTYPASSDRYTTSIGEQAMHQLQDGSSLHLNTNSQVAVAFTDQRRKITLLKGEAHFDVKPDPNRPFEVYAGDRMVRAIGTAFSVYLSGEDVKVVVSEGKVDLGVLTYARSDQAQTAPPTQQTSTQVAQQKTEPAVKRVGSLVAGESVVIPADIEGVANNIVRYEQQDLARRLAWIEGQLVFVGESLEEVVKEVSRYTSVKIDVIDDDIKTLRIGGSFQVGQTEKLFDALETGFNVKIIRLSENHVQLYAQKK